jgi:hypothetical protein
MTKKLVALSLVIIVLIILSSTSLVEGYTPEYNGIDQVSIIKDAISFTTIKGYEIRLAYIAPVNNIKDYLLPYLEDGNNGTCVYLDIINQSLTNKKATLTCVVYALNVDKNNTYTNLNALLLCSNSSNYYFTPERSTPDVTPYTLEIIVSNNTLVNNTKGFDLSTFEDLRMSLANTYNSQTITHAGYFLAILAIFATLISRIDTLYLHLTKYTKAIFAFFAGSFLYSGYRLLYWSWLGSGVLNVTKAQALSMNEDTVIYSIQSYLLDYFKDEHWLRAFYAMDKEPPYILLLITCFIAGAIIVYNFSTFRTWKSKLGKIIISALLASVCVIVYLFLTFIIGYFILFAFMIFFVIASIILENLIPKLYPQTAKNGENK